MKDKDLRSCFNLYGDLSGLDWYVKGRQALEGIRNMEATLPTSMEMTLILFYGLLDYTMLVAPYRMKSINRT